MLRRVSHDVAPLALWVLAGRGPGVPNQAYADAVVAEAIARYEEERKQTELSGEG